MILGLSWGLLCWNAVDMVAQQNIGAQIETYQRSLPTESVNVHLSETVVGAGEAIWFQAIISDADSSATVSEVVYLELLNQQAPVVQGIFKAQAGVATGQLQLPDTLSSGWYQLQAYTQYMRNGSPAHFFSQSVLVVNPDQPPPPNLTDVEEKSNEVQFFPEGGHWVNGVENRVVAKVKSSIAAKKPHLEIVEAEDSSKVADIALTQGVGVFSLTSEDSTQYIARLIAAQDTTYIDLPEASSGYTLQADVKGGLLQIEVMSASESGPVQLVVRAEKQLVYNQQYTASSFSSSVPLNANSGLLEVALLSERGDVVAQRMAYRPSSARNIVIAPSQSQALPRDSISFSLSGEGSELSLETPFSVAVRKILPVAQREFSLPILEKYGPSRLMHSMMPFTTEAQALAWVNQWLVTQDSPWPSWETFLAKPSPSQTFVKEDELMLISGKVDPRRPLEEDDQVLLSIPGDDPYFEYSELDADGEFSIPIFRAYGIHSVILQYDSPSGAVAPSEIEWSLDNPFAAEVPQNIPAAFSLSDEGWQLLIDHYRLRERIEAAYIDPVPEDSTSRAPKKEFRFYGAPNVQVNPDDYISLPSFEEICRELLPGVRLKEKGGKYDFDVFDPGTRTFLPNEPTLFLDGVPVRDISYIVNFPPDQIARIETVNRRTYYGSVRLDGVVAVYTKEGNAYEQALSATMQETEFQFYTSSQPFTAPDSLSVTMPDFRSLLYWKPKVIFPPGKSTTLSCITADELGTFEIVVEGLSADGERVYGRSTFKVVAPNVP